jgi:hypothetical protein
MGLRAQFRQKRKESRTIRKDGLSLYLDEQSRIKLCYQEYELTKHCGLSAEVLAEGTWCSSVGAEARAEKVSAQQMRITWKTQHAAVRQVWDIRLDAEGVIAWEVSVALAESLCLDAGSARMFLSKAYTRWTIPLKEGIFPVEFHSAWQPLDLAQELRDFVGCISPALEYPSIILKTS